MQFSAVFIQHLDFKRIFCDIKMQNNHKLSFAWIILATLGRLIPHPVNVTPLDSICLFAGSKLSKTMAMFTLILTLLLSDIILAQIQHHPILSLWSLFTYSGFIIITLCGSKLTLSASKTKILAFVLTSTLFFWVWTNFGVWLTSGMYIKSLHGLSTCYIAAIPFLRNSLLGNMAWSILMFGSYNLFFAKAKDRCAQELIP
jgi:hypothetical protein